MSAKDGGPAFPMPAGPEPRVDEFTHYNEGMTLRDYFAAKAMQALISSPNAMTDAQGHPYEKITAGDYVRKAYVVADAMLAEREK